MDWGLAKDLTAPDPDEPEVADPVDPPDVPSGKAETGGLLPPHPTPGPRPRGTVQTRPGMALGTPGYMAPEQARGRPADRRSDVFGLGAVLCEVLTGAPPFDQTGWAGALRATAAADLSDARARLAGCGADPELVALCERCLSPDPDGRPADAGAVAAELAGWRARADERARRAEVERATADARAAGERKRRRVQLALAGAVLLLAAGGGAFAWWNQRARSEQAEAESGRLRAEAEAGRQGQAVRDRVTAGRAAAAGLLEQTEKALGGGDAERAGAPLAEAALRVGEGGLDDLRPRLERCRRELDLLRELDAIDNARWTLTEGRVSSWETTAPRLAGAFAGYGIAPGMPPAEAAARVNGSLVRERLLRSLEAWFVDAGRDAGVRAVLSAADPDEFRDEARATNYQRALLARAFRGEPLPPAHPVWFALAHGGDGRNVDLGPRKHLLVTAYRNNPDSFPLVVTLGLLPSGGDPVAAAAAVGWWRAALALRPGNAVVCYNLGYALHLSGDRPGAEAAFRGAVRLDPKFAQAYTNLGAALLESGDLPGATAALREAVRHDRRIAQAHINLGYALQKSGDTAGAEAALREAVEVDGSRASAHANLAAVYLSQKKYAEAVASARKAVDLDRKHSNAYGILGAGLFMSKDVPGARTAFTEAARLDPKKWGPRLAELPPVPVAPPPRPVGR